MITTTMWGDLTKNALVHWREGYKRVPVRARSLFDSYGIDQETSEHSSISSYTFARRKNQGSKYKIGSPKQGYTLNLSQSRIGLMDEVTWEMRRFDKYRKIKQIMRGLGEATAQRMELDCTHQFTFGMSVASYTNLDGDTIGTATADGQNIFDTDHTITGGSGTYSNLITREFSRTGLEDMEALKTKFVDDSGNKIVTSFDTIFHTDEPSLVNKIKEFLGSMKAPDNAENAINVYKGKYTPLELPYLATDNEGARNTDIVNYYGLWNKSHTDAIMEISEYPTFKAAKPGTNSEDFDTDGWKYKTAACYDMGVLDFKCGIGSTGAVAE